MNTNINKQLVLDYELIDYNTDPNPYTPKVIRQLTESEAHAKNQGFALNGITKRYVKMDDKER